ncbi:MAG: hypothetical protein IK041_08410, partial [Bacteroidales bacterium]|nr:hypothetical protein [Bacteroidales bacterium]
MWFLRLAEKLPVPAQIFLCGVVRNSNLVQQRLHADLMGLKTQIPWIIAHNKAGNFLVCKHRDTMPILPVGLSFCLCDDILPPVQKLWATRAVGDNHIRLERLHALEFLV